MILLDNRVRPHPTINIAARDQVETELTESINKKRFDLSHFLDVFRLTVTDCH
jgi:hypothetical protein